MKESKYLQEEFIGLDDVIQNVGDILPSNEIHAVKQIQIEVAHLSIFLKGVHSERCRGSDVALQKI